MIARSDVGPEPTPDRVPFELAFERSGRNGTVTVSAIVAGRVVYTDKVDITKESERRRFLRKLLKNCPGADEDDVNSKLQDFANGMGRDVQPARAQPPPVADQDEPYLVVGGRLCHTIVTRDGSELHVPICNFDARIVEVVVRDDGVETTRRLRLEGKLAGQEVIAPIDISARQLSQEDWPLIVWSHRAFVRAGQGNRDHLRAAIQYLSGDAPVRTVRTFTGWCEVAQGTWAYLHAGGAIGQVGAETVSVELPDALARYRLPTPPAGEELVAAVRASLDLARGLAPDKIVLPLLATIYRAVVPGANFSVHLAGITGSFKTELAALAQQHYGAEMNALALPASWSSTGNSLEAIAFSAKDALLVVDDFAPTGNSGDIDRYHREADRLFRAQGNRSGRQRLRPDGTLKPAKPPRGVIVSTGEDIPKGHSLRARLLVIEVGRPDVHTDRLSECQRHAAAGVYAAAMAGFLEWLAPQFVEVREDVIAESLRIRSAIADREGDAGDALHRRTPTLIADLLAGLAAFLRFAQEVGAIDAHAAAGLVRRCKDALLGLSDDQTAYQTASDPCDRYIALLASALSSGRAHLANKKGDRPEDAAGACGWRLTGSVPESISDWQPQGRRIGWIAGEDLYLDPDAAYAEAMSLGAAQKDALAVTQYTLHQRLDQGGKLVTTEKATQGKLTVRRSLEGARRYVLHLRASQVLGIHGSDQPGPI